MKRALVSLFAWHAALASALEAPNAVTISQHLVTSGQPNVRSLASLREEGFSAVIYLVPPNAYDAVPREAEMLREQGIEYVQVPIQWEKPSDADYDAFAAAMKRLGSGKVLVHCQINLRVSTMAFLYRVVALGEGPDKAYESVASVWSPNAVWKRYIVTQLARVNVAFEPY